MNDIINKAAQGLNSVDSENASAPSKKMVENIILNIREAMFPKHFVENRSDFSCKQALSDIYTALCEQISAALAFGNVDASDDALAHQAEEISLKLINELPTVKLKLIKDVEAGFNGDPAAQSRDDIIISYPGLFAIFVYRIAHILYELNVPLIPRIMTEYAHSCTGIDINAGASIGENFFIDHGTGVVIGETTVIGNGVKLYQGVTLGALSTRKGQELNGIKRHPTIEDNVTIYANSTILGGNTVIGEGAIIGGNAFITKSIPAGTKVIVKAPELIFKNNTGSVWEI